MTVAERSSRDERAAIDKAFSLLAILHEAGQEGAGVSALARRSDLSKSTAFRVLSRLEHNGAVEKVGTAYRIGSSLRRLGHSEETASRALLREVLTPFLVELHAASGATTHLAVLDGTHVLYLNKINGHRSAATRARIGHLAPAHCTSVGKALLAYRDAQVDEVIARGLCRRTEHTITDPATLRAELARVRATGIATDVEEAMEGVVCTAVGLAGAGVLPIAAISLADSVNADTSGYADLLRRVRVDANLALAQARVHVPTAARGRRTLSSA